MEDLKMSDKRKAPDKTNNDDSLDLNESSLIDLKPARKRPRMEDDTGVEVEQDEAILDQGQRPSDTGSVPVIEESYSLNQTSDGNIIGVDISLGEEEGSINPGILIKDSQIALEDSEEAIEPLGLSLPPLENGSRVEELEQLGKTFDNVKDDEDAAGDDGDNNNVHSQPTEMDVSKFKSGRNSEQEELSGSDPASNGGGRKTEKLEPRMTSSPLSDSEKSDTPSREVNISLKAFDPKTGKLVFEEPCIQSDYIRLEVFLNQHNKGLSGVGSGYLGDIDSSGGQGHQFSVPQPTTGYNRKGRWTSSTLGSSIPRDSMKTVLSNSPNGSPDYDDLPKTQKRGKRDPKLASTRLSDSQSPTGTPGRNKGNKALVSNGDSSPTNGFETPPANPPPKRRGSKSSKKSTSDISSGSKSNKKRTSAATVDKTVGTPQQKTPSSSIPKSRSASISKEFSRLSGSPMAISSPTVAEPSPARAVAIVEGTAAKPLTKFEQEVNNEPVDLSALKHSKTLWGAVATNNPVFARWSDKNYYSGFIKEKGMNDTWIIDFDDATTYAASEAHIIPIKILGVGIKGVYCPDTGYHPADATVLGQKFANDPDIGETVKYAIKLNAGVNEGQTLWCTRRMLSIKENDARLLRQEFQPDFKAFKAAEVSLENIIPETSRRRVTTSLTKSLTPQQSLTPKTPTRKIVGGAFDASTTAEDSHNESNKQTPKRKPKAKTPIKKPKGKDSNSRSSRGSSMTLSSSELSSSGVEKSSKESPKRSKLKEKTENQVFAGYQFFMTASGGGDPASNTNSGPHVPYDKDEYRDLVVRKGGKIVDIVGQEDGKEKTFLVSDNFARTVKYIYCLAASIPCVSHKWVLECISNGKIVPWESYELNAGYSLETNKVILPHKKKPLEGFEIYITAGSNDLYDYWKPVLTAAHAKLLKPKKVKGKIVETDIPKDAQVLVTDATCSTEILAIAHERMIPVVKPEWLVQSIIAGNRADFFNHEKYRVEVMENEDFSEEEYSEDEENQS